jgi:protocatechuate 3,4-dioxygenase beta subunit
MSGVSRLALAVLLCFSLLSIAPPQAVAELPNDDIPWPGYWGYDIVYRGVWSRQAMHSYLWRFDDRGFDANFVWYSYETVIQSGRWDNRVWSSLKKDNRYSWYSGGYWWTPLRTLFYGYPATFRAYAYGNSFIAKACGNFSWWSTPVPPPTITGYKWNDLDGDGAWDAGEPPLPNWTVNFYRNGAYVGSTTTQWNGKYTFVVDANVGRLPDATYTMTENLQPGWIQTRAPGGVWIYAGVPGVEYSGYNFGNFALGSVSGTKWIDSDFSGSRSATETVAAGWPIELRRNGALVRTTTTGLDGRYQFTGLSAGTYTIHEPEPPEGWVQTYPKDPKYHTIIIRSGSNLSNRDFGNAQNGSIQPLKVEDLNLSGFREEGERYLAGWTMHLGDAAGTEIASPIITLSEMDLSPAWQGLAPGDYTVWEDQQEGWFNLTRMPINVTLGAGQKVSLNVCNAPYGSINGVKFHDLDKNGSQGPGEDGIPGWTITLTSGSMTTETVTGANGEYAFRNVYPGTYELREELRPPFWRSITAPSRLVDIAPGQQVTADFGNLHVGCVEGYKYHDLDGDGLLDAGEQGLSGVQVILRDANGSQVGTPQQTDTDGRYSFESVETGAYTVEEVLGSGWMPSAGTTRRVDVMAGHTTSAEPLFNFQGVEVSGTKYSDEDADGRRSIEESGLPGWEIVIERDTGGVWAEVGRTITGDNGTYSFNDLWPGRYRLREVLQPHWQQTESPGETPLLASGGRCPDMNFGNVELATLTVTKWDDSNANGLREEGEAPLPWPFEVSGSTLTGDTYSVDVSTGSSGTVDLIDLLPGEYRVIEHTVGLKLNPDGTVAEPGWRPTTTPSCATITVGAGSSNSAAFGNLHLGWIWGRVTHEVWGYPIANIPIRLEETGQVARTNADGYYFFYRVEPNETSSCPRPNYSVAMNLDGTDWNTRRDVDRFVVVPEGGDGRSDFTVWERLSPPIGDPKGPGYWKNWRNHLTTAEMQHLVDLVSAGSPEFEDLTVAEVSAILTVNNRASMYEKARAQYLTAWLNMAAGYLQFDSPVDLSAITGWDQILGPNSNGVTTVLQCVRDIGVWFSAAPESIRRDKWEIIKSMLEVLNQ